MLIALVVIKHTQGLWIANKVTWVVLKHNWPCLATSKQLTDSNFSVVNEFCQSRILPNYSAEHLASAVARKF